MKTLRGFLFLKNLTLDLRENNLTNYDEIFKIVVDLFNGSFE